MTTENELRVCWCLYCRNEALTQPVRFTAVRDDELGQQPATDKNTHTGFFSVEDLSCRFCHSLNYFTFPVWTKTNSVCRTRKSTASRQQQLYFMQMIFRVLFYRKSKSQSRFSVWTSASWKKSRNKNKEINLRQNETEINQKVARLNLRLWLLGEVGPFKFTRTLGPIVIFFKSLRKSPFLQWICAFDCDDWLLFL